MHSFIRNKIGLVILIVITFSLFSGSFITKVNAPSALLADTGVNAILGIILGEMALISILWINIFKFKRI